MTGILVDGDVETGKKRKNLEEPDTPTNLKYTGIAVFNSDKLIGWLNENESKGYSNITNELYSTIIEVPCPSGGVLGVEVIRSKTNLKGEVKAGKPEINISMRTEANVGEVGCKINFSQIEEISALEKEVEKVIITNMMQTIRKGKKMGSDIFGFGSVIHQADPRYWAKVKDNWYELFPELPVKIKVDVRIRRTGTVGDSFINQVKE